MKIDHEYLKRLLHAFAEAPGPTTDINELEERGVPYDDPQFIFHMAILEDKGLVEQEDHDSGFGMRRGADGDVSWAAVPLRLTAAGHEFLEGLEDERTWPIVKRDFKHGSIEALKALFKAATEETAKVAVKALFQTP
jgi:hypothetical protein